MNEVDEVDEYLIDGYWCHKRNVCQYCFEQRKAENKEPKWANQQYSFGIYAGRYCDECWLKSGYRDATDPNAKFDPADAGERLEPEE